MQTYIYIAQIIVSVVLVVLVLMQNQGGGMGGIFGSDTSIYRTRRGLEKTLYQLTIITSTIFFLLSMVAVRLSG